MDIWNSCLNATERCPFKCGVRCSRIGYKFISRLEFCNLSGKWMEQKAEWLKVYTEKIDGKR